MKNNNKKYFFILFISLIIFFSSNWMNKYFGEISVEQLLFHIFANKDGTNIDIVFRYLKELVIFLFFSISFIYLISGKYFKIIPVIKIKINTKIICLKIFDFDLGSKYFKVLTLLLLCLSFSYFNMKINVANYLRNRFEYSNIYEEYYVDPNEVNIVFPEQKRNLIYIILESMESSFYNHIDDKNIKNNLIPNLKKISEENISFSSTDDFGGLFQSSLTTWTVASLVGQTAGVPLNIPIDGNSYGEYNDFLPGITNLGDILKREDYNQVIMMGSDGNFAGRKNYFSQHGDYLIWDYYEAIKQDKIDNDYFVFWGFEDKKLFEYAKEKVTELSLEEKPFNFTMLTVDTHFLDGYVSEDCNLKYNDQYSNAIYCADNRVLSFLNWIQEQDFYQNTSIIIIGDHLTMNNQFFNNYAYEDRFIYNALINVPNVANGIYKRQASVLDFFPTTLASLGVEIEGNKLGLGVNLFSEEPTLIENIGYRNFNNEILKNSKYYFNHFIKQR